MCKPLFIGTHVAFLRIVICTSTLMCMETKKSSELSTKLLFENRSSYKNFDTYKWTIT